MPLGMQFLTRKLLTTTGPFGFPIRGSISSMVPVVRSGVRVLGTALALATRKWPVLGLKAEPPIPAGERAPLQFPARTVWLQNNPALAMIGPSWQSTFFPPVARLAVPQAPA